MTDNLEAESMKLLTRIIRQYSHFCHSMIIEVKNSEQLSISGFAGLEKAQLSVYHINRASNMLETLLGFDRGMDELSFQSFNIMTMMDKMCKTLTDLLSAQLDFSIKCTYSLESKDSSIEVDQSRLELIIFNILYYCFNATALASPRQLQIEMHIHEDADNFFISVTDTNAPPLRNRADLLIFDDPEAISNSERTALLVNFDTVSLFLAKKLAIQTNYELSYTRVRESNRYIIRIPKHIPRTVTNGFAEYETNTNILMQCFAGILLHLNQE